MKPSDGSAVGHVPDLFLHVFTPMLESGEIAHMSGTANGVPRAAPAWVPDCGIEIPCKYRYVLYGVKKDCSSIWQRLRDAQKSWKLPRTED